MAAVLLVTFNTLVTLDKNVKLQYAINIASPIGSGSGVRELKIATP
jgi:hypothetical protein